MEIHHIGIIVNNLEKNIMWYSHLGYAQDSDIVVDNIQYNRIVFLQSQNNRIELIEPLNEKSSIKGFKEGYHHICYNVKNPDSFLSDFRRLKIGKIFTKAITSPAIENRNVIFACLRNGTYVEFLL